MGYQVKGQLLEVCTCNILCPCWVGEDPDSGTCDGVLAWHYDEGHINGVDVAGRTFVYTPRFSRDESTVRFLDRVFDGAADQLVMSLLRTERIAPQELDRMEVMIAKARRKRG